ncbi:NAD-binding protein [Aquabacterium sp. J223]|uniref:NAD-binding protein n=1 Tax=Aquabacterium sp. J223 TaxID=2898431 RepID=UPI00289D0296|nr:NAD-binding protein [Aquabacterium sp. J223]
MKLAGNLLIASAIATMTEAFGLAARHGVPPAVAQRIVTGKLLRGPVYEGVGRALAAAFDAPARSGAEFEEIDATAVGFTVDLGLKDLRLAAQAATAVDSPMRVVQAVRSTLEQAAAQGLGPRDWSQLPRRTN